jgi:putative ABC transport system permease protein
MNSLVHDVRYGLRMLTKRPGFTAVVVLTLALGIGANTVMFSVLNVLVLRPLPYVDPDRLVVLSGTRDGAIVHGGMVSYAELEDFRTQSESFEGIAALHGTSFTLSDETGLERIGGAYVSAEFFSLLGIEASRGRLFLPEEDKSGAECVAVVSDAFWQRRFGKDPGLVGQTLVLDGVSFTVVGVLPPDFMFPIDMRRAEIWTTVALDASTFPARGSVRVKSFGRLKPNISIMEARAEMDTIAARLARQYPVTNAGREIRLRPLREMVSGETRAPLFLLLGAVGLVLLIACANVASMLLARGEDRRTELAIRAALGASRRRLMRQTLIESALLAGLGCALGLLLAYWALDVLVAAAGARAPGLNRVALDGRVLGFTLVVAGVTSLLIGLSPAVLASRPVLHSSLKEGGRTPAGTARRKLFAGLLVGEVALALVLLAGAGLLLRSFQRLTAVDPGFQYGDILTFQLSVPRSGFSDPGKRAELYRQVIERLEALPGVQSAGASTSLPLHIASVSDSFAIVGRPRPASGVWPNVRFDSVSPEYFQTMGVPLLAGRFFSEQDTLGQAPVMIINQTMAKRYWPDQNPLGERVALGSSLNDGSRAVFDIVGVVGDLHDTTLDLDPQPCMYVSYRQQALRFMFFALRTSVDPLTLVGPVRKEVSAVTKEEAPFEFFSMQQLLMRTVLKRSVVTLLLSVFAAVAVGLSALGMYGMISYSVARRTHEIGVRMAIGAQRSDVLRLVLLQGFTLTVIGLAVGIVISLGATRVLASLLHEISATDPATFFGVSVLLAAVAFVACYIPARRATKVDPMVALRCE